MINTHKVSVGDDMSAMHRHYGVPNAVDQLSAERLLDFLKFRLDCIQEELTETTEAVQNKDPEEVVDGLIDLIVFAVGTLDLYGIDFDKAWKAVYNANMNKKVGVKTERPNPWGLPDLIKEPGWVAPSHEGNHGLLTDILSN